MSHEAYKAEQGIALSREPVKPAFIASAETIRTPEHFSQKLLSQSDHPQMTQFQSSGGDWGWTNEQGNPNFKKISLEVLWRVVGYGLWAGIIFTGYLGITSLISLF